ncbi:hypothetical protein GOY13_02935 [Wolbachia endosymbiont of Cruorifilaria tuberocauda]|uniref:hypothetical protein n=1 Tax=Wolbachia endosymbiont of Cruorifilaria tuberocauda TaxID=1812111 RepID=UPI00158C0769|nr:hypothetical protein [Wolbachia endosymbiont of Cruorifilaria tuberocauda]QKX01860.1 hypothetical protein GOY13_02935 [Wolbachia endosymbiont of Cruorifilaria tuberocauda]
MGTSRISSSLKYSIATSLLCASVLTTGIFIYPISLAIHSSTAVPPLYATIVSISIIIALSSAMYLSRSILPILNNKEFTCNLIKERQNINDASTQTPQMTTGILPFLSAPDLKESTITSISTSSLLPPSITISKNSSATFMSSPPSLLHQSTNVPPPPPLPPIGNPIGSTVEKNLSITKLKGNNKNFQDELKEKLQKIKGKIAKVSRHEIL